jgi:hypothetical protein
MPSLFFPFRVREKQSHPASGLGVYWLWASKENEQKNSHQIDRTYSGPPPEVEGLDQN